MPTTQQQAARDHLAAHPRAAGGHGRAGGRDPPGGMGPGPPARCYFNMSPPLFFRTCDPLWVGAGGLVLRRRP